MSIYHTVYQSHPSHDWICFFHGLGGSHRMFAKQIESLQSEYNLLLFDLPGHGSSLSHADYSRHGIAESVLELMDSLKIQRAHFLGVSLGTIVIQEISYAAPERILSIINGGTAFELRQWGNMLSKLVFAPIFKETIPYLWNYKTLAYLLMPKGNHKRSRHYFIQEAKKMKAYDYFKWCDIILKTNVRFRQIKDKLPLHIPQLHIMGAEDHMFLKGVIRHFYEEDIRIIKKCGHVCNLERPKEFNQHVMQFLAAQKAQRQQRKLYVLPKVN